MEKGINLREQILKFYRDYYHGGLMKLVVIGGGTSFLCYCLYIIYYTMYCSCLEGMDWHELNSTKLTAEV